MKKYRGDRGKSRLKVVRLKTPPNITLGGVAPSDKMPAGECKICCQGAAREPWKNRNRQRIVLKYRIIEGEHTGVALTQWIPIDVTGVISPGSKYAMQCEIALGRPIGPDDDLNDPGSIFRGAIF